MKTKHTDKNFSLNFPGGKIDLKRITCGHDGKSGLNIDQPGVSVYVRATELCPMNCPFCEFHNRFAYSFDPEFLMYALTLVKSQGVKINKLSFTGGEPMLVWKDIKSVVNLVKNVIEKDVFVTVNTADYRKLAKLRPQDVKKIDSFSVSVHHYLNHLNTETFGQFRATSAAGKNDEDILERHCQAPSILREVTFKDKVHISCNLIKEYIDSGNKMSAFIEIFSDMGFNDFGFVGLMPVNEFTKKRYVDFASTAFSHLPNVRKTDTWNKGDACRCENYIISTSKGDLCKIYARHCIKSEECTGTLVIDDQGLRAGFTGPVLLKKHTPATEEELY